MALGVQEEVAISVGMLQVMQQHKQAKAVLLDIVIAAVMVLDVKAQEGTRVVQVMVLAAAVELVVLEVTTLAKMVVMVVAGILG